MVVDDLVYFYANWNKWKSLYAYLIICQDFKQKNQYSMLNLLLADVFIHHLFDESMRSQRVIQYGQFYNLSNLRGHNF